MRLFSWQKRYSLHWKLLCVTGCFGGLYYQISLVFEVAFNWFLSNLPNCYNFSGKMAKNVFLDDTKFSLTDQKLLIFFKCTQFTHIILQKLLTFSFLLSVCKECSYCEDFLTVWPKHQIFTFLKISDLKSQFTVLYVYARVNNFLWLFV